MSRRRTWKNHASFGWEVIGWDDLEDLIGECENCGEAIRYVFLIKHVKWGALEVGEICCDNLTCTELASNQAESIRRYNERKKRFAASPRWGTTRTGNLLIRQKGMDIAIVQERIGYRLRINGWFGKIKFENILDAKIKAFDSIESGAVQKYFSKLANSRSL